MSDTKSKIEHMFEDIQPLEGSSGATRSPVLDGSIGLRSTLNGVDLVGVRDPRELVGVLDSLNVEAAGSRGVEVAGSFSDEDLFDLLTGCMRLEAWLASRKAVIVKALAPEDSTVTVDGYELASTKRELVAVALNIAPRSAQNEVQYAHHLLDSCSGTFSALEAGDISSRAARVIVEETYAVDRKACAEIEAKVLPSAGSQIPSRIARNIRRVIHSMQPKVEEQAAEACVEKRSVTLVPQAHGMATVEAYLPAAEAVSLYNVVSEIALCKKSHDRADLKRRGLGSVVQKFGRPTSALPPIDAYRADAMSDLARIGAQTLLDEIRSVRSGAIAVEAGVEIPNPDRFQAHVVLDLPTALGLADNPGELAQYGPIPGPMARELAIDAGWQAWVVNAGRQLQAVGSKTYRPAPSLRRFIVARDQVCQFPGCSSRSVDADLDHSQPYGSGGATSSANLHCLCRRHHRMKTHLDWESIREEDLDSDSEYSITKSGTTWRFLKNHTVTVGPEPVLAEPARAVSMPVEPAMARRSAMEHVAKESTDKVSANCFSSAARPGVTRPVRIPRAKHLVAESEDDPPPF